MIIVSGATGKLGAQVVEHLLERVPAERVGVSVRDPAKAAGLARRGVRVRRGDFADPASLADAFAGASRVLLISADVLGPPGVALHRTAVDAARDVGAERLFYASHQAAAADSLFGGAVDHAATERYLRAQSTPFTLLRNGFYASTVPWILGDAASTGRLEAPEDGPVSWTTIGDLAEAAAVLLAGPEPPDGDAVTLTAAETVDLAGVAAILSELTGRRVDRVEVPDDEWAAGMAARGVPSGAIEIMLGIVRAARRGEFAVTDPLLGRLLGRAVSLYEVARLCRQVNTDPELVAALQADPVTATAPYDLTDWERGALLAGDVAALHRHGVHGLLLSYLTHAPVLGLDVATYSARMRRVEI